MINEIENDYKIWLTNFATEWIAEYGEYSKLINYLYSRVFYSIIDYDSNREMDGKELRIKFVDATSKYTYRDAYLYLSGNCRVLEMMVALALKCEEQIMHDFVIGDRSKIWFYTMICSLGLNEMTDENYDEQAISEIIDRFLARKYDPNGSGGLFYIENPTEDMRNIDIWYQLNYYLRSLD